MPLTAPIIRQPRRGSWLQLGAIPDWSEFEIDLPIVGLAPELDGLRILHLSDTHFGPRWSNNYDRVLERIAAINADLIAFTGDWVEDKFDFRLGLSTAQRFARGLTSRLGVFSCLGNHDGDLIAPYLVDSGVGLLVGEMRRILGGASSIEIVGLPAVARADASPILIDSFGEPAADAFRIVLTHFPDHVRCVSPMRPHLVLAGHTHGGQLCLPGGRPLLTHDSLEWKHASGLHRLHDTWLHVTRGLGCSAWPIRAWCAAEMTVIRISSFPKSSPE